jgi:hypothetical protein
MRLVAVAAALLASSPVTLGQHGIGAVRFGETERSAVSGLTALFGAPTRRGQNPGCGPRFVDVAWGRLSAEFRNGRFVGFRYVLKPARFPTLATATGITLGSTLGELRAAYRSLRLVGTDRWRSPDGLVFYDDAKHDPVPPSSRIVEIKTGTCGDF